MTSFSTVKVYSGHELTPVSNICSGELLGIPFLTVYLKHSTQRLTYLDQKIIFATSNVFRIPEFAYLGGEARQSVQEKILQIKPELEIIFTNLSTEAYGALILDEKTSSLYDQNVLKEAADAIIFLLSVLFSVP